MALLSAGKQISVGGDKSYGRGLFIADPQQVQRRARKQQQYQEELRLQMEQDRRRKEQKKRKQAEEDMRLEKKIKQDLMKQNERKGDKSPPRNDKNYAPPPQQHQPPPQINKQQQLTTNNYEVNRIEVPQKRSRIEEPISYKFHIHSEGNEGGRNPYLPRNFNLMQAEEERFFEESNSNKIRVMHEMLDEKMSEVYKRIKHSQDLEVDKEFQTIRKKIMSSNTNYDTENLRSDTELQGEISHFYRIPKKHDYHTGHSHNNTTMKNLNYEATSSMKRTDHFLKPVTQQQQQMDYSRNTASREMGFTGRNQDEKIWGVKKGKNNFLGNREAMDFQINSIMGKIDNMLEQ